jgi:hypothetical protein
MPRCRWSFPGPTQAALGGEAQLSDTFQHLPKGWLWSAAHSSIRIHLNLCAPARPMLEVPQTSAHPPESLAQPPSARLSFAVVPTKSPATGRALSRENIENIQVMKRED